MRLIIFWLWIKSSIWRISILICQMSLYSLDIHELLKGGNELRRLVLSLFFIRRHLRLYIRLYVINVLVQMHLIWMLIAILSFLRRSRFFPRYKSSLSNSRLLRNWRACMNLLNSLVAHIQGIEELVLWWQHHQALQQILLGWEPGINWPHLLWTLVTYFLLYLWKNLFVGRTLMCMKASNLISHWEPGLLAMYSEEELLVKHALSWGSRYVIALDIN